MRGKERSIAAKLLVVIAGLSLVLTLLISALEIWQEGETTVQKERSESSAVVMANIDTLASTLWSFDRSTLAITARSLTHGTSIFQVEIEEDGATVFHYALPGALPKADHAWSVPLLRANTNQKIGTLKIWESYRDVQATLQRRALSLIVGELAKVLATSAVLFVAAYLLVARPLRKVAREIRRMEEGREEQQISIRRIVRWGHDEIDALVDAINASNLARRRMAVEQRKNQQREANAGKLRALGQLAGGIAHDFNNILGAILGFAAMLEEDLAPETEQHRFAGRIMAAAHRGRDFISQIWTFAQAEKPDRAVVDLAHIVHQSVFLLEPLLPKNVEIDASYAEPQFPILADTTLVGQLITNLCLNAGEAFEGRDGNVLISLTHAKAQELEALFAAAPNPQERLVGEMGELGPQSDFACLRVLDTAGFIPPDVLEHIFEPFFSTKARKVGAGLGLAVVQSVVASHGGVCHIASREGEGTMFSVYFPLSPLPLGEQPVSGDHKFRGAEGIMIVDDEQDIVEVLSRGLERLGYQTVGIDDPVLALASFEADPDSWDVLLTDQMMPGMTGVQLIAKIRKIKPGIKVICCTGYSKELKLDRASRGGADIVLLKPVTAKDVARQIRLMMQSRLHPAD